METDSATRRSDSTSSAHARPRRNESSSETIFLMPGSAMVSLRRRASCASDSERHRWSNLDMRPAISKARMPTVALFRSSAVWAASAFMVDRTVSSPVKMADFTLLSHESNAMVLMLAQGNKMAKQNWVISF